MLLIWGRTAENVVSVLSHLSMVFDAKWQCAQLRV